MPNYVLANEQNEVEKYPYNAGLLRRDNPNTSFPKTIPKSTLNSFDVYEVSEFKPDFDSITQFLQKPESPVYQDGQWKLTYQVIDKTQDELDAALDRAREEKLSSLRNYFVKISQRPIIDTGYGFNVQAGYSDLLDFQVGLDLGLLTIRASDNNNYTVTSEQFADIISKIKQNGVRLKSIKWALQDELENASAEELKTIDFEERFSG